MKMKYLCFIATVLVCLNINGQIPDDFKVISCDSIVNPLETLKKITKQQYKPAPTFIEITNQYITQDRTHRKLNPITGNIRSETTKNAIYFENITDIEVKKLTVWKIYFKSKTTGQKDLIILNDKTMAEQAYSAMLCLMKAANNKVFKY